MYSTGPMEDSWIGFPRLCEDHSPMLGLFAANGPPAQCFDNRGKALFRIGGVQTTDLYADLVVSAA